MKRVNTWIKEHRAALGRAIMLVGTIIAVSINLL